MQITLGQQYNVGEKPTVIVLLLFSHIQRIGCQPEKKKLYTVANPARGLLNREKKKKKKSGSAPPPPPPRARCSFGDLHQSPCRDTNVVHHDTWS